MSLNCQRTNSNLNSMLSRSSTLDSATTLITQSTTASSSLGPSQDRNDVGASVSPSSNQEPRMKKKRKRNTPRQRIVRGLMEQKDNIIKEGKPYFVFDCRNCNNHRCEFLADQGWTNAWTHLDSCINANLKPGQEKVDLEVSLFFLAYYLYM